MPYKLAILSALLPLYIVACQTMSLEEIAKAEKSIRDLKGKRAENLFPDEFKRLDSLLQKLKFEYERGQKRKAQGTLKEIEEGINLLREKLLKIEQPSQTESSPTPSPEPQPNL